MDISDLKKQRKESSLKIQKIALEYRFDVMTPNAKKLRNSLIATRNFEICKTTLLDPQTHEIHAERLLKMAIKRWIKVKKQENDNRIKSHKWNKEYKSNLLRTKKIPNSDIADEYVRAFTLIDSVCILDHQVALQECLRMKQDFQCVINATRGIGVLAVIECEVISISKMRLLEESSSDDEHRKLNTCEVLASNSFQDESSLFLIHLHGLFFATNQHHFETLRKNLLKEVQWNKVGYQLEIKKLSTEWNGKIKSVETNLKHWCKYITKGGNEWNNGKAYLRYKVGFNSLNEDDWMTKSVRHDKTLKANDGVSDSMSLSMLEISELALLIDGLMKLNRTRTGYLITGR